LIHRAVQGISVPAIRRHLDHQQPSPSTHGHHHGDAQAEILALYVVIFSDFFVVILSDR